MRDNWGDHAACKGKGEVFFPSGKVNTHTYDEARLICLKCVVFTDCREYGDKTEGRMHDAALFGFLAGESPALRVRRRSRERRIRLGYAS